MESWNRFINSINGKPIDQVPLALIGTNRFYASLWNEDLFDILHNPQKMIDIQSKTFKRFPQITFIPGAWPDYGVGILSSFSCQIKWQRNTMPQVSKEALHSEEEIKNLRIPDPQQEGFMPWYLQTLSMFIDQADSFVDNMHFLWSFGPGELASYLWGTCKFLGDLIQQPDLMMLLLDKVTLAIIKWLNAQQEINQSADAILLTDDISGLLSESLYQKCLFPFQQKIISAFPKHLIVFHNDAKSDHILNSIRELGIHVFNLGKSTNLELAAKIFGGKISIMGNLDPLELLIKGSKEEIINEAKYCLSLLRNNSRFILSAGGGLNDGTPVSSIEALIESVEK